MARAVGLTAMALTDHDCTDGVPRFLAACEREGVRGVGGVEISVDVKQGSLHMLGYFMDLTNAPLCAALTQIRDGRRLRNTGILAALNRLGLTLTADEVAAYAGEDTVGRPHFAQAMLARGYIKTKEEAFDRYLGKGKPAYVERFRMDARDSIALIRGAGGVAVLAHPFTLDLGPRALEREVGALRELGLGGIEVYYSEHNDAQVRQYERLARQFGLVATGGSDFHGEVNPRVRLGIGFGGLNVPDAVMEALDAARAAG